MQDLLTAIFAGGDKSGRPEPMA